jgi:hypothetical protein
MIVKVWLARVCVDGIRSVSAAVSPVLCTYHVCAQHYRSSYKLEAIAALIKSRTGYLSGVFIIHYAVSRLAASANLGRGQGYVIDR